MGKLREYLHKAESGWDEARIKIKNKLNLLEPVIIYPYRGFGNESTARISGRVLERESNIHQGEVTEGSLWDNLKKAIDRYESDEIPGVGIEGVFRDQRVQTKANEEGYFHLNFDLSGAGLQDAWYPVELHITDMPYDLEYEESTTGEIQICNQKESIGIISDVDDTIIESHATNPFQKMITLLKNDATTRVPFEGVEELYRELSQDFRNPLFFVSGSSYNLYDLLTNFCKHHNIPKAPFLLRDLGLDKQNWFKEETMKYKLRHIEEIFETYPHMQFILIGDSGQKDPEIYQELDRKYPDKILAVYIRQVESDERSRELDKLRKEMKADLLLMEHSSEALEHARRKGFIS